MAEKNNFDVAEYNAFGPWAYEISEKYPMPRLFAPYFTANDEAIMKIKIPREIERRNAAPGMDLYDFVIALYEDKVLILQRQKDEVKEYSILLKDFKGVRIYENMLKGGYTVFSAKGTVSFPFNAVSIDLFRKFTKLLLDRLQDEECDISSLPVTQSVPESTLLINMLHDFRMELPDINVGAVQKSTEVHHKGATWDTIERLLWKEMNPEALHLYTKQYLIVLENGVFPNRVGMQEFGYTQTIIPLRRISNVEIKSSDEYSLLEECNVMLGSNKVTYHFELENEEVAKLYNTLK